MHIIFFISIFFCFFNFLNANLYNQGNYLNSNFFKNEYESPKNTYLESLYNQKLNEKLKNLEQNANIKNYFDNNLDRQSKFNSFKNKPTFKYSNLDLDNLNLDYENENSKITSPSNEEFFTKYNRFNQILSPYASNKIFNLNENLNKNAYSEDWNNYEINPNINKNLKLSQSNLYFLRPIYDNERKNYFTKENHSSKLKTDLFENDDEFFKTISPFNKYKTNSNNDLDEKLNNKFNLNKEIDLDKLNKFFDENNKLFRKNSKNFHVSNLPRNQMNSFRLNSKDNSKLEKKLTNLENGKTIKKSENYQNLRNRPDLTLKSIENKEKVDSDLDKIIKDNKNLTDNLKNSNYEKNSNNVKVGEPVSFNLSKYHNSNDKLTFFKKLTNFKDINFIGVVLVLSLLSIFSVISLGHCFYVFKQHNKATADTEYPAYGVVGPAFKKCYLDSDKNEDNKPKKKICNEEDEIVKASAVNTNYASSHGGDRKLAQNAQMYHYQHQKQQMIASEKNKNCPNASNSDLESEEENEEGDYTVYECPGLASTVEIEVNNPLFENKLSKEQK